MENQVEGLQERLRPIGSRVGDRLYTRCRQELESLRIALAMGQASAKSRFMSLDRLALSGNTTEVNRIESVVARIESRIRLTEMLDERQTTTIDGDLPPSLCWDREKQIRSVQAILSRQFFTGAEGKIASETLDDLADPAGSLKTFALELEARITALRRQFASEPWNSKRRPLIDNLAGCADLLKVRSDSVPDGGWTPPELAQRDLVSVRLRILYQLIAADGLLADDLRTNVLKKLESSDPAKLASAQTDMLKVSQGITDAMIRDALCKELWDMYSEPINVTDQDALRLSFLFRNKELRRCAAKDSFQCFWKISNNGPNGPESPFYEQGWEVQCILPRGEVEITPQIYDNDGNEIPLRTPADQSQQRAMKITVTAPLSNTLRSRLVRGLLDAAITALVPVVTVAITQTHTGDLGVEKLVLLGFTSQAIRAAVVPESISVPTAKSIEPT